LVCKRRESSVTGDLTPRQTYLIRNFKPTETVSNKPTYRDSTHKVIHKLDLK